MKSFAQTLQRASFVLVFTLTSIFAAPPHTHAEIQPHAEAAKETPSPSCSFEEDIAILKTLTAELATTASEEDRALLSIEELDIRKRILKEVVACAAKSARALRETVRELQVLDGEGKYLQGQFISDMENAITHYERIGESIEKLDSEGVRSSSAALRAWREETYSPLAERAGHFVVWTKNQDLLDRAQTRLSQTRQIILSLRLAQNEEIRNAFERANTFFLRSGEAHRRAQQSLSRKEAPATALEHIKSSLGELYRLYETLFELNETIQHVFLKK